MSRKEIVGEKFTIAFGVDHMTGAFVQLWENPSHEQDASFVNIDSDGVRLNDANGKVDPAMSACLRKVTSRFQQFNQNNPGVRPNIDEQIVIDLAKVAGGFPDISREVYQIFGEDI